MKKAPLNIFYFAAAIYCMAAGCRPLDEWQYTFNLRTENTDNTTLTITNRGIHDLHCTVELNGQAFFSSIDDIADQIQMMDDEYSGEDLARKVWRFACDYQHHEYPLGRPESWYHDPVVYFNSAGIGWCGDAAAMCYHLWQWMGFETRVWLLEGHMVSEVYNNGCWEMYDADEKIYYYTEDKNVAGVEDLAANPDLVTDPIDPILGLDAPAYWQYYADCYATTDDNVVVDWEVEQQYFYDTTFTVPPDGSLSFPGIIERPLVSSLVYGEYFALENYGNLQMTLPAGWSGTIELPLILHAAHGAGTLTVHEQTFEIDSTELSDYMIDIKETDSAMHPIHITASDTVDLIFLVNPHLFTIDTTNTLVLSGTGAGIMKSDIEARIVSIQQ